VTIAAFTPSQSEQAVRFNGGDVAAFRNVAATVVTLGEAVAESANRHLPESIV